MVDPAYPIGRPIEISDHYQRPAQPSRYNNEQSNEQAIAHDHIELHTIADFLYNADRTIGFSIIGKVAEPDSSPLAVPLRLIARERKAAFLPSARVQLDEIDEYAKSLIQSNAVSASIFRAIRPDYLSRLCVVVALFAKEYKGAALRVDAPHLGTTYIGVLDAQGRVSESVHISRAHIPQDAQSLMSDTAS